MSKETLFLGSQDSYEIRAFDGTGSSPRLIRLARPPVPPTPELLEEHIAYNVSVADTEDEPRRIRSSWENRSYPDFLPACADLFADALGYLWVEEYRLPGSEAPHTFTSFDLQGRLAGSLAVPSGFRIQQIGAEYLLSAWWDQMDIESIRVYGLTRPRQP